MGESRVEGSGNPEKGRGRDAGQQDEARKRQKIQRQLDEALANSFPASDPVSIVTSNEEEDWGAAPDSAAEGKRSPEDAS